MQYNIDVNQGIPSQIPQVFENRQQDLVTYLRSLPYVISLNDNQIDKLANQAKFQAYGKGELIIQEGKKDEGLCIMFKGTGHAYIIDEQGSRKIVDQLELNEAFGEMAIFAGEVVADDAVTIVVSSQPTQNAPLYHFSLMSINLKRKVFGREPDNCII